MHAFLGGEVPHSILDEQRLGDDEKLKRRLHCLNIMAMEGWEVSLQFWEVGCAIRKFRSSWYPNLKYTG